MKKVFVAGHLGMVGSAITRILHEGKDIELVLKTKKELDLTNQKDTMDFLQSEKFDEVYLAAAKVGGIHANNVYPAEFIYNNIAIASNVIESSYRTGVKKLLSLGSSCIYPKISPQPIKEEYLLDGRLEPTNEPYAIAKIAAIKMCESYNRQYGCDFRSVMPTNLYGENDNFHPESSHVIPSLIRKFHEAKIEKKQFVEIWGSGKPMREFLYVEDMAKACVHVMGLTSEEYKLVTKERCSHLNIGTGIDITIAELAETIGEIVQYSGDIKFNVSKPDGMQRKLLDVSLIESLGWRHLISLKKGLRKTYRWYLEENNSIIN